MEEQKLLRRKRKALSDGNKILLAKICIDLGEYYMRNGHFNTAIEEFAAVADVYMQIGKRIEYGSANRMIGEAYMQISKYDKSLEHFKIHLNVACEERNDIEKQRALANLGHLYLTKYLDTPNNPDKSSLRSAYNSFMKSMEVCEKLSNIDKKEHMDMTARLLANLGIVEDNLKNYEKGIELMQKSIKICKDNDLHEQLERSYRGLGLLYFKKKDYGSAVDNYNLAIKTAELLPNKIDLTCESLSHIADVLIAIGDLRGAKNKLRKAYNLKSSNVVEHENITRNLKIVAAMCYAEDSLETTPPDDHEKRKKLYEKLGDGACRLKHYPKAIAYYENYLKETELNGDTGKELSLCYISLAQTYKDNGDYMNALKYFQKEYNLNKHNDKESVDTLFVIVDMMENAGCDVDEVDDIYRKLRSKCILSGSKRLENKAIKRHVDFLRTKNRLQDVEKLENLLGDYLPSDDEDGEEDTNTPDIGEELNLSDITDVSDEGEVRTPQKRTRTRTLAVKKNLKGETQLHTACINGKVELVKKLLEQGHPVDVRDGAGWLPIHEACNWGNLEIVKLLVEYKADFNDRGGKDCRGVTPLHDACTNGHLEIIQYLLDHGASVIAKNDIGETPLHCLKKLRQKLIIEGTTLTADESQLFDSIEKRMTATLERFGVKFEEMPTLNAICSAYVDENEKNDDELITRRRRTKSSGGSCTPSPVKAASTPSSSSKKRGRAKKVGGKIGDARRRICDDDESEEEMKQEERVVSEEVSAKNEYKKVMDNLRRRTNTLSIDRKRKSDELTKRPALIENYVDDDWLEDDLGITSAAKKRKSSICSTDSIFQTSNTRKSSPVADFEIAEIVSDDSQDSFGNRSRMKRKIQIPLTKVGFSRSKTSPPKKASPLKISPVQKVRLIEADSSSGLELQTQVKPMQMLSIDVRIEEKLYRVPIPAAEIHSCTIKWLAEEAAKRYFKREGIKPFLELETRNGAILAEEDLVSMLFPAGSGQAEELKATITRRSLPPLIDRYEEACQQINTTSNDDLKNILRETSTVLDLSDLALRGTTLSPLFKAINRQDNLVELNLTGNLAKDECFQLLCASLPTLTNLATLNLCLNNLTAESLKNLSDTFTNSNKPILEKLVRLNLSYNPICDEGFRHLAVITRYLRLKSLNLASVDFTEAIFENFHNKNVEFRLETVEGFYLCHNRLNKSGILRFVSWLNPRCLEELDLSNNRVTEQFLLREMLEIFRRKRDDCLFLKKLGIADCLVGDSEIFDLLLVLPSCNLNLSNNKNLTWDSLKRLLLHRPSLLHLDIYSCDNIFKYFNRETCIDFKLPQDSIKSFVISQNDENCIELLQQFWKDRYKDKAGIVREMRIVRFFSS